MSQRISPSLPGDLEQILNIYRLAFDRQDEANWVQRLLEAQDEDVSLVLEKQDELVAHVLCARLGVEPVGHLVAQPCLHRPASSL